MTNIGIITQARIGSTRLPQKILRKVNGIPLLEYHLQRLQQSGEKVYTASTFEDGTEQIEAICRKNSVPFFQGSTDDVLERFHHCACEHELDIIVRVTSDCPLIDGEHIKKALDNYIHKENSNLYYANCVKRTFPRGFDFEIFTFDMLQQAYENGTLPSEREHVTPYFRNHPELFDNEHYTESTDHSNFRLTVDTEEDFTLIKKLIETFHCAQKNGDEIIEVLLENMYLTEINQAIVQKEI